MIPACPPRVFFLRCIAFVLVSVSTIAGFAQGQRPTAPTPAPQPAPKPTLERELFKNILRDQRAIWTSPLRAQSGDARWLAPLGLSTAALIATDGNTADALGDNRQRLNLSRDVSYLGSGFGIAGVAAAFYLVGRVRDNPRARETGLLGLEALIDGQIVVAVLKSSTQRPRPRSGEDRGEFFDGGHSFPSGHCMAAWSLAAIVANEYRDHRFVQVTSYGLAAAVSASRYTGRNHFLSDVLVGSIIGYGIGRYVYRAHHNPSLKTENGPVPRKRFPVVVPRYSPIRGAYGITLNWSF